jgi:foldase protein PrsA
MKKRVLIGPALAILVVAVLALVGCGDKLPKGAIAKVHDGVVTKAEFDKFMAQAKTASEQSGQTPFPEPGSYQYDQYAAQLVDYLVRSAIYDQAARDPDWAKKVLAEALGKKESDVKAFERPVTVTDKEIDAEIAAIEESNGGTKKVDQLLKQLGMTRQDLRDSVKQQLVGKKVGEQVVSLAKVSDAQIKAYYDKYKDQFNQPEVRTTRHILVKTKAEALKVRGLLVGGASWKDVAKQYSLDKASKNSGGALGDVKPGIMFPAFEKAAFALKLNQISEPVKTSVGWHVIQVTKITPGKKQTLEQVKSQIEAQLLSQEQQTVWDKWFKRAQKEADIQYAPGYDPAQLKKTKPESPSPSGAASPSPSASPSGSPSPSATQ